MLSGEGRSKEPELLGEAGAPRPNRPPPTKLRHPSPTSLLLGCGAPWGPWVPLPAPRRGCGRFVFSLCGAFLQVGRSGLAYGPVRETEAKGANWCLSGPTRKASTPSLQPNWGLLTASTAELPRSLLELGRDDSIPGKEPRGPRLAGTAPGLVTAPDGSEGLGGLCPRPPRVDLFCLTFKMSSVVPTSQMARPRPVGP